MSASSPSTSRSSALVQPVRLSLAALGALSLTCVPKAWSSPEKIVGVQAWTSGSQTYVRSRPAASTPAVAKVTRHTPLYVWGKFNGWYRVETHDHIFGWVHNEYINSPDIFKVRELSHFKARVASTEGSKQTMYGTPQQLKAYYARYGGTGALRGLKKHGILLAKAPASKPVIIAARPLQKRTVEANSNANPSAPRIASARPFAIDPNAAVAERAVPAPQPSFAPEVQAPAAPSRLSELRAGMLAKLPENQTPSSLLSETPPVVSPSGNASTLNPVAPVVVAPPVVPAPHSIAPAYLAPVKAPVYRAPVAKPIYTKPAVAKVAVVKPKSASEKAAELHAARAKAAANKAAVAKAARIAKWKNAFAWRQKQHELRLAAQQRQHEMHVAARQTRLASRAKQRQQLSARVGLIPKGQPPVSLKAGQIAPVSPEELMKARDSFLANRNRRWAPGEGLLAPVGSVAPLPNGSSSLTPAPNGTLAPAAPGQFTPSAFHRGGHVGLDGSVVFAATTGSPSFGPMLLGQAPLNATALSSRGGIVQGGNLVLANQTRGGSPRDRFAAGNAGGQKMATKALSYRGMPYIFGASSPRRGFDCSGLVFFLLRQRGYNPPRTAAGYRNYGQNVPRGQWQAGDLVLFANTYKRGISHIGVYLGNNKFIHAATAGKGVRVDSLSDGYYAGKYWGARRVK